MTTTEERMARDATLYAQGARCGHLEGKHRVRSYVLGEEDELADAAAWANVGTHLPREFAAWKAGYKRGYRFAAEGEALPAEYVNAPLPERIRP